MTDKNRNGSGVEAVRRVCEHWPELTREEFHALLAPDCVYLNVPMPQMQCIGPDQAYDFLQGFMGKWMAVELSLRLIRGDRDAVLVERVERFRKRSGDGPEALLRSMGAFELRDGKIAHWRDYFDPREASALAG